MPPRTTRQMSDAHEQFLADLIGGVVMPGSGNGFANQMDVRNDARREPYPLAVDGKSTRAQSIGVTLEMWRKALAQAHNCLPALALRWYHDDRLRTTTDLIVVRASDFGEILWDARSR
jgi:hypothetical protein